MDHQEPRQYKSEERVWGKCALVNNDTAHRRPQSDTGVFCRTMFCLGVSHTHPFFCFIDSSSPKLASPTLVSASKLCITDIAGGWVDSGVGTEFSR